jgi:NAD(P)-dependent dehydrogenase (short-subunit alcohol dehydrogenase family)
VETKTVLVTGASRGIGEATAETLARQRTNLVLFARTQSSLVEVAKNVEQLGGQALPVAGDVASVADCRHVLEQGLRAFGSLHAVINNAGVIHPIATIDRVDVEAWSRNWRINFLGPLMLSKLSLPYLREVEGRVINISSGAALRAIRGWAAYSTAKAALDHLTLILAAEEKRLTCVGLRPGVVDTQMQVVIVEEGGEGMPQDEHAKFVKQKRDGKLISPELPARAAAALALHAPKDWSGETLLWNEDKVQDLVDRLEA